MLIIDGKERKTKLMEDNHKVLKELQAENKKTIEKTAKSFGIQKPEDVLNWQASRFSIKKFREAAYRVISQKLQEANSELMFGQLLRAGVLNDFNNIYQEVEVTYTAAVKEASSNKRQEFYAPLERAGFPKRVQKGESFPETAFKGLDIEIINSKWGLMLNIEKELMDDDQTGQILQLVAQLAVNTRIHEEAYVWGRISGATGLVFDGEPIPVSKTYPTPYVGGVPGVSGGLHGNGRGVNVTAAARISQTQIQSGWILAKKMLDQSGRPIVVDPKLLAVSPQDVFNAEILMTSETNPSSSSTQTADIGKTGSIMSINPIKNLTGVICSRFIPDYGAYLIDPGKGFVMQRRDPVSVEQENPMSGPAFSQEVFRHKVRTRWEADFIDPKFMIDLNSTFSPT